MVIIPILLSLIFLAAVLYYLLITTEGVFLGRRVVVWLYDITAHKYDGIKQFDLKDEAFTISRPLLRELANVPNPIILDVATGSGRVPFNLLQEPHFHGRIIGLDPSRRMLNQAVRKIAAVKTDNIQILLIQQTADALPFPDNTFQAVTCLEALEFFPSDTAALQEIVRVLQPGGLLMTSRRKGWEGKAFLGRFRSDSDFQQLLDNIGLIEIRSHLWEINYDMLIARKRALNI